MIKQTNNSLYDIINWLKEGYIICLYSISKKVFYFHKENLNEIKNEKIIYINLKQKKLLDQGEWIWYIENEGFKIDKYLVETDDGYLN